MPCNGPSREEVREANLHGELYQLVLDVAAMAADKTVGLCLIHRSSVFAEINWHRLSRRMLGKRTLIMRRRHCAM